MTRAPLSTAQRIAAASATSGMVPSAVTTFAMRSCAVYAMPTMPVVPRSAAISPATKVPWPSVSRQALPPTKLFSAASRPLKSGSAQSRPESTTATFTGCRSSGGVVHASKAWSSCRYHCRGASGFVGVKAAAGATAANAAVTATSSARRINPLRPAAPSCRARTPARA